MHFAKIAAFVTLSAMPYSTLAQTGRLAYSPQSRSVPVDNPIFLFILALCLALTALWLLKSKHTIHSFLVCTALAGTVYWGFSAEQALARVSVPQTALNSSSGGSVIVPRSLNEYRNTTGVNLEIRALVPPCTSANSANNACALGQVLAPSQVCATRYLCQ